MEKYNTESEQIEQQMKSIQLQNQELMQQL